MMQAVIFEEHASVLPHWAARGLRDAPVVVLDAHLDLQHVDDGRIERLRRCGDADALRALESPHPFAVAPDACFGIEDFLYPAARLGLVGRIVWVAPPHALRHGFAPALERLVQMEGVTLDDIQSLDVTPGGWIEGRLMGIPLAVCTLGQLRQLDLPSGWQLDIDVDYFVELPGDRVWADPAATLSQLSALPNCPSVLTISLSVGSGFTPLHLRHLGERLAQAWTGTTGPHAVSCCDSPSAWARGGPVAATDLASEIAATHSRRLPLDAARLREWQHALGAIDASSAPTWVGPAWVMLGLLLCAAGLVADACLADAQAAARGHEHPELALALADTLTDRGDGPAAMPYALRAAGHSATRVRAWVVLSRLASLQGRADEARAWCVAEVNATPANPWALARLAERLATAGDAEGARTALRRRRHLTGCLDAAASRLDRIASTAS